MTKKIIIGVVIVVVLILAFVYLYPTKTQVITNNLGALAGPDISSTYMSFNGNRYEYRKMAMASATTTICAMRAPAATSTLVSTSFQVTTGTSTAATIDVGTSTNAFATTTNLITAKSISSGAQGYAFWSPSGAGINDNTMGPNEWVVVKTAGAGLGGYTYGGNCQAVFKVL